MAKKKKDNIMIKKSNEGKFTDWVKKEYAGQINLCGCISSIEK